MNKKKLQKRIARRLREERGASIIMIIVLIAFLAILMSVLMSTTMFNYRMKIAALRGTEGFYKAEAGLEEKRNGIARVVSDALRETYLESLRADAFSEDMAEHFQRSFAKTVTKRLKAYDGSLTIEEETDRILIRGLQESHTDEAGYRTLLTTDIAILLPDRTYWETHPVMEVKDLVVYEHFTEH